MPSALSPSQPLSEIRTASSFPALSHGCDPKEHENETPFGTFSIRHAAETTFRLTSRELNLRMRLGKVKLEGIVGTTTGFLKPQNRAVQNRYPGRGVETRFSRTGNYFFRGVFDQCHQHVSRASAEAVTKK